MLRRVLSEKRVLVWPLGLAVAVNVAVYALLVYPLSIQVARARERSAAAVLQLGEAHRLDTTVRATLAGKERAGQELQRFYEEVLPKDLSDARRVTYLHLAQLAEESGLRYERRNATPEDVRDSRLGRLDITMVLAGEYADVRQFIHRLETTAQFIVVDDVSLAQGEDIGGPLVLTLKLSTYYIAKTDGSS